MPKEYIMTAQGKRELEERLERIKNVEMPAVVEEIATARAQGDLSENAEYVLAREHQAKLQGEMDAIMEKLVGAKVLDEKSINDDVVSIGCSVEVIEADAAEGLAAVEKCGFTRSDVIVGFLSRMSVSDMKSGSFGYAILGELKDEDYVTAAGELLASKRYKKDDLLDKGFTEAELSVKAKNRSKIDKSKCEGLKVYTIVGSHEADVLKGRISNESRVGSALLNKAENDVVMVGDLLFKIVDIFVDKKAVKK